ncbi:alpha/beta hydrolase [Amycolatopsis sp.]|uniref:alpha/beta hydrolase n=1 Tax=Amycolatopsis sp. TaxID=37632 RepID=UPI002E0C0BC2|nr:alpha/beta fold hydrolase [Amycolatopsis sp.]
MSKSLPALSIRHGRGPVNAVVLVLHGGREHGHTPVRPWSLAYLRMVPLAKAIHSDGAGSGVEVRLMRNRVRGWNAPGFDPVRDARWALARIKADHPGVPVILVGHSMGGRVALRVADDPAVVAVCALAPWTPAGEPVAAVEGRDVLIVHGTRDRMTDPAGSLSFASRAQAGSSRLVRFEVGDEGHAMLRRSAVWTRLVTAFTLGVAAGRTADEILAAAWTKPSAERLRIPV